MIVFDNSTMTLADGSYELNDLLAWENVIKATKHGYCDNSQNIILMQDFNNELDFEITPLPLVTINAKGAFEIACIFWDKTRKVLLSFIKPGLWNYEDEW